MRYRPDVVEDARQIVAAGYDVIAQEYLDWSARIQDDPRSRFLELLLARLSPGSEILDLGCGAGTARLAERHRVFGVDLSAKQVELARLAVPGARFAQADMTDLDVPPASLDAVTAFYSILHVPRAEQPALFARIAGWLRPGGLFLAALGAGGSNGVDADWLGAPMFFSSHPPADNRVLLHAAGLRLLVDEPVTIREPEGPATFHWVLATPADR
ncbi:MULTISPECIES: class I SAM-dependent methyltransferase [unclassified Crossiella]|uniref:class I SAM-dependent methyltransferase n=1 Tax=unclassified Crossiella TaxID=2620835 RepID=UPI001FFF30DF|nr:MULTISPECIES: class I SAM-dependent methyltransferase [unclassified Crossiella]MCK2242952.1 class I SAM-dependent methyltransferase [Crossiella sp. S99.2]MCK2256829.1 class I SAM-dependent methyltransferase [Crossiella sp. S99.1]